MGILRQLFSGRPDPVLSYAVGPAQTFAVDAESIEPGFYGMAAYANPVSPEPRIDRRSAMQVPAVARCRTLVAASIGGLPLEVVSGQGEPSTFLDQPEVQVPRSITMTNTVEDLMFEGWAWWQITESDYRKYPTRVKRLNPRQVSVDEEQGRVYVNGQLVPDEQLIRFYSPTDALLVAGARAIRTALRLDAAASNMSDGVPPIDYFTPADGSTDPGDSDEIREALDEWQAARRARTTAYVPAALNYNVAGWDPEKLQMAEQRNHAVLEIARIAGVDPEELGISTTSRTYANMFERRKAFIDFTLGPYMRAIEDRLSMGDVTPRGTYTRFNLDAFLRSSTRERYEAYEIGLRVGALAPEEIRPLEDKQPLAPTQRADLRSVPTDEQDEGVA